MKPFLIIENGATFPELEAARGGFARWLAQGLGLGDEEVRICRPYRGEALPDPALVRALVLSGSHAMVSHREPWSEALAAWLREAVASGVPALGVCYGHQLLAHALGGEVASNPKGPEFGCVPLAVKPDAAQDELLSGLPGAFPVLVCHSESVLRLPEGALSLAASELEPNQAVRFAPGVWGVQFHPEFDGEVTAGYVRAMSEKLKRAGRDPQELEKSCADTPLSASILPRFAAWVRARQEQAA